VDRSLEAGEGADERGFADAIAAHKADHFARMEGQVELVEEGGRGVADGKRLCCE
jgi:hypothetical protein